jgi:hypothetical protein
MAKVTATQSERKMQNALCEYIRIQYPKVKFRTDKDGQFAMKSALRDKKKQASAKGFPDLIIREKRHGFNGLVMELKRDGEVVFKKDGTLRKDAHLSDQQEWLDWFESLGCKALFSIGFDESKELIDCYLR